MNPSSTSDFRLNNQRRVVDKGCRISIDRKPLRAYFDCFNSPQVSHPAAAQRVKFLELAL